MDTVLMRTRPLFVVCEVSRRKPVSNRPRVFRRALRTVCKKHGIMILDVHRQRYGQKKRLQTDYQIAEATAARFAVLLRRLPKVRNIWQGPDGRIGVFLAVAAAIGGWTYFRPSLSSELTGLV